MFIPHCFILLLLYLESALRAGLNRKPETSRTLNSPGTAPTRAPSGLFLHLEFHPVTLARGCRLALDGAGFVAARRHALAGGFIEQREAGTGDQFHRAVSLVVDAHAQLDHHRSLLVEAYGLRGVVVFLAIGHLHGHDRRGGDHGNRARRRRLGGHHHRRRLDGNRDVDERRRDRYRRRLVQIGLRWRWRGLLDLVGLDDADLHVLDDLRHHGLPKSCDKGPGDEHMQGDNRHERHDAALAVTWIVHVPRHIFFSTL